MAAPITGCDGALTLAGHVARITDFTITTFQRVVNTSAFGDTGCWETNYGTTTGYRLDCSGFLEDTSDPNINLTPAADKTGAAFTCTLKTGITYTGEVVIEGGRVGHSRGGVAIFTMSGVGDGALVENYAGTSP